MTIQTSFIHFLEFQFLRFKLFKYFVTVFEYWTTYSASDCWVHVARHSWWWPPFRCCPLPADASEHSGRSWASSAGWTWARRWSSYSRAAVASGTATTYRSTCAAWRATAGCSPSRLCAASSCRWWCSNSFPTPERAFGLQNISVNRASKWLSIA